MCLWKFHCCPKMPRPIFLSTHSALYCTLGPSVVLSLVYDHWSLFVDTAHGVWRLHSHLLQHFFYSAILQVDTANSILQARKLGSGRLIDLLAIQPWEQCYTETWIWIFGLQIWCFPCHSASSALVKQLFMPLPLLLSSPVASLCPEVRGHSGGTKHYKKHPSAWQ